MKDSNSQPTGRQLGNSDVESEIHSLTRGRLLSKGQASKLLDRLKTSSDSERILGLAKRIAHGRRNKRDEYVATLNTIKKSLSDHSDTTACEMIHEYPGFEECPKEIRTRRIGCPHGYFQIKNAILALTKMCFIRNAETHLSEINFLNESLGQMDDTLAGQGYFVDIDKIPEEQRLTIDAKDRMRKRILKIVDIALEKINLMQDPGEELRIST